MPLNEEVKTPAPSTAQPPATPETSPASAPVAAAVETPPASDKPSEGSELFTELANDTGDDEGGETPPAKPAETVAPPAAAKPAETPPAPSVEITSAAPVETPPPAAATPPAQPPAPTEEERRVQYDKDRAAAISRLTEQYAIKEEDAPALITEPEKVLPRLMAEMHARVMENVANYMQQALPHAVRRVSTAETAQQRAAKMFFDEWPELNKPEYGESVARVLAGYRQANPEAKPEDVIREGGVAALVALRIPIPERVMKRHNVDTPDATKPGVIPPAPGGATRPPAKPSDNVFTVLAMEDVE